IGRCATTAARGVEEPADLACHGESRNQDDRRPTKRGLHGRCPPRGPGFRAGARYEKAATALRMCLPTVPPGLPDPLARPRGVTSFRWMKRARVPVWALVSLAWIVP